MSAQISLLFLLVLLSACQSVGTQYQPPYDGQDSAEFSGREIYVNSFSEEGCYSGRTYVPKNIKLHADKEVVMAYEEKVGVNSLCQVLFSFAPQIGGRYQLLTNIRPEGAGPTTLFGSLFERPLCNVAVVKLEDAGTQTPVPITGLKFQQTRITCIKVVPK